MVKVSILRLKLPGRCGTGLVGNLQVVGIDKVWVWTAPRASWVKGWLSSHRAWDNESSEPINELTY